jgi:hypothetical protein
MISSGVIGVGAQVLASLSTNAASDFFNISSHDKISMQSFGQFKPCETIDDATKVLGKFGIAYQSWFA